MNEITRSASVIAADINGVIVAMNGENPGSGENLRGKCEAAMLRLFNTYGWQI